MAEAAVKASVGMLASRLDNVRASLLAHRFDWKQLLTVH
jgi:hypothetical protein